MTEDRYLSGMSGMSGSTLLMSFLRGAVAGAAVALLTTPKRGSEMREQIRNWASNSKVGDVVQRATTSARRAFDDVVSDVNPDH
jgi:gas vesicle protein